MYHKHHDAETRKRIAEAGLGKKAWNRGLCYDEKIKKKMKEVWYNTHTYNAKSRKIRCMETGCVFNSAAEVDRFYKFRKGTMANIMEKSKTTEDGNHWEYLTPKTDFKKKIKCLDTGIVYPSIAAAARAYGGHASNISTALKKGYQTSLGHKWELVKEEEKNEI